MEFIEKGVVFLVLWLIASLVWAIWLDGINVAIAGCLTGIAVVSVININLHNK
ncbi:MAG: hypothetical protein ABH849_04125 [Nanoarchaeota archaeon]